MPNAITPPYKWVSGTRGSLGMPSSVSDTFHPTLMTASPTLWQRRAALAVVVVQFVTCAVVAPIPAHLPRIDSFVPVILAIVFVADFLTAVLLFSHTTVLASRATLILANGYLFSALIIIPHALTFPGSFGPQGLLGGVQSSGWLNVLWHFGFLTAVAGYACLKDGERRSDAAPTSALAAFFRSLAIQISVVCALTWGVTAGDTFMPRLFLDDLSNAPLVHYAAGMLVLISVLVLLLLWRLRKSALDLWIMVTVCMLISEMVLVTFGMTARFYLGWYVSRTLAVAVSTVVLVALLAEAMRLHAEVLKANMTLRRERDHKNTLISELDHRVKNVLATVCSIIGQTRHGSGTFGEFVVGLDSRIRSLANTHDLLSRAHWHGIGLAEIAERELAPYGRGHSEVLGPSVTLRAEAAQAVAMVLHELTTNAAKYGALSKRNGCVLLKWWWQQVGGDPRLVFEWKEVGGPRVGEPSRSGYGSSVVRELIPFELDGTVDLAFAKDGLRCRVEIPADWVSTGGSSDETVNSSLSLGQLP
jgi:two-component sensor histidine kinase